MLAPELVLEAVRVIRQQHSGVIYLYTAKVDDRLAVFRVLQAIDGICVTLHKQNDVKAWIELADWLPRDSRHSMRLNVFKGVDIGNANTTGWMVKYDIIWIIDCPLPDNEVFMRLRPDLMNEKLMERKW
jgi:hypothetical protein